MAISEDLRSVQTMLKNVDTNNSSLIRLLCDNLSALADQVEALEDVPLAPWAPASTLASSLSPSLMPGRRGEQARVSVYASPCREEAVLQ